MFILHKIRNARCAWTATRRDAATRTAPGSLMRVLLGAAMAVLTAAIAAHGQSRDQVQQVDPEPPRIVSSASAKADGVRSIDAIPVPSADAITTAAAEPVVVTLYVVYTAAAEDFWLPVPTIEDAIGEAVSDINLALVNSLTNVRIKLVRTDPVTYMEPDEDIPPDIITQDLERLRDGEIQTTFGVSVHKMREKLCADLVMMVVDYPPLFPCGEAYVMTGDDQPSAHFYDHAFSVIRTSCLGSFNLVFTRLLAQNMGCFWDHLTAGGNAGTYPLSHGHRFTVPGQVLTDLIVGTIMTRSMIDLRLLIFSNPIIDFLGVPTGALMSDSNPADNARTINLNALYVAAFGEMACGADHAEDVTVCPNGHDDGPCDFQTIQAAIDAAQYGGRIIVSEAHYNERIDFKGRVISIRSTDPLDPDVVANTVIDGTGFVGPVVTFNGGEEQTTVLHGFTITGGSGGLQGGGVYIKEASPMIVDCVIRDNAAELAGGGLCVENGNPWIFDTIVHDNTASFHGGGVFMIGGSPILLALTIHQNNAALGGGGIYAVDSGAVVRFSQITDNVTSASGSRGGGVFIKNGAPTVRGTVVAGNTARLSGGGLYSDGSNVSIRDCEFLSNSTTSGPSRGGGLHFFGGAPTLVSSIANGNSASLDGSGQGGGVFVRDSNLMINDCIINQNSAGGNGGGVLVFVDQDDDPSNWITPVIASTEICQNSPNNIFGPWTDGENNTICPADADIHVPDDYPTIQMAIDIAPDEATIIVAPGFYPETINFNGKALHLRSIAPNDPAVVASTVISGEGVGPVVRFQSGEGPFTRISGFTITGGSATGGGGIRIQGSSPTIEHCVLLNNSAGSVGGGLATFQSAAVVRDCRFINNTANTGGGLYSESSPNLIVQNCVFEGNHASSSGGAMANFLGDGPTIDGVSFEGNTAGIHGGAIYNASNANPLIINSTIRNNTSSQGGGGVHSTNNSNSLVGDTAFCDNSPAHIQGPWKNLGDVTFASICPPMNNLPSNPQPIDGESATIIGSFEGATNDGSSSCEPDGVDVFFSYTVSVAGVVFSVDTCGSNDDTALAVFDPVGNEIGCSDDCGGSPCGAPDACLTVTPLVAGTYLIRVSQVPPTLANQPPGAFILNVATVPDTIPGDLNGDGVVDGNDLLILLSEWGECPPQSECPADLNNDGTVDGSDLLILLSNWG